MFSDKRLKPTDGKLSDVNDQTEGRRKAARMLVAVVILFAICFLPLHSLNIIRYKVFFLWLYELRVRDT